MSTHILDSIESRLHHHAQTLNLSEKHQNRARSLAVAGTVSALLGITPAQLFELLRPAFIKYLQSQGVEVN